MISETVTITANVARKRKTAIAPSANPAISDSIIRIKKTAKPVTASLTIITSSTGIRRIPNI